MKKRDQARHDHNEALKLFHLQFPHFPLHAPSKAQLNFRGWVVAAIEAGIRHGRNGE
jgi:hypothetical protein